MLYTLRVASPSDIDAVRRAGVGTAICATVEVPTTVGVVLTAQTAPMSSKSDLSMSRVRAAVTARFAVMVEAALATMTDLSLSKMFGRTPATARTPLTGRSIMITRMSMILRTSGTLGVPVTEKTPVTEKKLTPAKMHENAGKLAGAGIPVTARMSMTSRVKGVQKPALTGGIVANAATVETTGTLLSAAIETAGGTPVSMETTRTTKSQLPVPARLWMAKTTQMRPAAEFVATAKRLRTPITTATAGHLGTTRSVEAEMTEKTAMTARTPAARTEVLAGSDRTGGNAFLARTPVAEKSAAAVGST